MFEEIIIYLGILLPAIILHECAHAWSAYILGDPTAKQMGRLTLNPFKHIDPVGSLILPGFLLLIRAMGHGVFLFGWAKPVPVNFLRLNNPKRDMMWVGMAGPAINVILAIFFSLLLRLSLPFVWVDILKAAVFFNLLLAIFNMVPIPPLDGSRLVMGLLPKNLLIPYSKLERFGILIVFALIPLGLFDRIVLPLIIASGKLLGVTLW
ncbi:MAG: site-2 protease family protein [Candidatus Omnitrophica bacterium]|nr:site-2 protease family protein [Candidatus Omnitrophota bacterium]